MTCYNVSPYNHTLFLRVKGVGYVKQNVEVLINGQVYRIATEYDPRYMQDLARTLDTKLTSVLNASRTRSLPQALILVSLDVIDEYMQMKENWKQERDVLRGAVKQLTEEVERNIARLQGDSAKP